MKTKILLWVVVSILVIGIALGAFWWLRRPQVIVLDNGDKLTLVGMTYGKRHAPPGNRAPLPVARGRARGGPFDTANDSLVIWIRQEHPANQQPQYQLYAYDKSGTACVGQSNIHYNYINETNEIVGVQFDSFPRWQGKFYVRVQEYVPNQGQVLQAKRFVIATPARKTFEKWTAESLPVTRTDGNLSVTLAKLTFGAGTTFNRADDSPQDAINKGVEAVFQVQENGTNAVNWRPVQIETLDETGNHQSAGCNSQWKGDEEVIDYQWGLWPDEPAWKLRVEFAKQSGFSDDELWTVKIPLQPAGPQGSRDNSATHSRTNSSFAETDLNGIRLKIFPARRFANTTPAAQPQGDFEILATPTPSDGLELKLISITGDQTNKLESRNSSTSSNASRTTYHFGVSNLDGVTNINVTIGLPKNLFFEFTAKPEKQ